MEANGVNKMAAWLIASNNKLKTLDLQKDLAFYGLKVEPYTEYFDNVNFPAESVDSYRDNAVHKATFLSNKVLRPVIGDDSGIEIPALSDELGVTTKRDLHKDASLSDNQTLLSWLKDVPEDQRQAKMIAYLAAVDQSGQVLTAEGEITGQIALEEAGTYSTGFDKIFYLPELGKTLAELPDSQRIELTHRGRAAKKLVETINGEKK